MGCESEYAKERARLLSEWDNNLGCTAMLFVKRSMDYDQEDLAQYRVATENVRLRRQTPPADPLGR